MLGRFFVFFVINRVDSDQKITLAAKLEKEKEKEKREEEKETFSC